MQTHLGIPAPRIRRSALLLAVALVAAPLVAPSVAHAGSSKSGKSGKHKKSRHREPTFTGHQVPLGQLRNDPLPKPSGELRLGNVNFPSDTLEVNIYNADGSFDEEALDKLNHFWRCRRTGTEKPINPHLFELLSHVYDHFQAPIDLVSGFRNQEHTSSFHFHGSASDIRVRGVEPNEVHAFIQTLDGGGMGLGRYPNAHFVHVDVRPEPSFRWVDRSPPGGEGGSSHGKKKGHGKKHHNA